MTDSIAAIPLETIAGKPATLGEYAGKVILAVNVASKCGLTPQYEALEKLYSDLKDKGLVVCGFPANDFGAQEPGSHDEIVEFCTTNFGVDFPMFAKMVVSGPDKHPLYAALTSAVPDKQGDTSAFRERLAKGGRVPNPDPEVLWNFEKFVIGRSGDVVARFAPTIAPDDPAVMTVIEAELAK